jgi:hypothetical protein
MQWEQMKKNVGCRVQLLPVACRLDEAGQELPSIDDDWIVEEVAETGVRISNTRTSHTTTLGADHIHHFTSNPDRSQGGIRHGFLTLHVQLFLQGSDLKVRPNSRPGEPVKPQVIRIAEKWTDINYPFASGLQGKLERQGYRVGWCRDTDLPRKLDIEGWEVVVEPDANGIPTSFHLNDLPANQTLVKKRVA